MSPAAQGRLASLFELFPRAVAVVVAVGGVLVLSGWFFDVATLKGVMPGWTLMKANTAMAMVLCGVALWATQAAEVRVWRVIGRVCSAIVLLLGLLTLAEYLSGRDFGIDRLLIREITNLPGDIPGRMALNSALSFSAVGAALLLLNREKGGYITGIHALLLVPFVAAGSALIGYGYDIEEFRRVTLDYTPMALSTAVLFVLLAFGIASARPEYPFRRFVASASAAGLLVRRLLPAVILFTLAIGWLIQKGYHARLFSAVFGFALFAALSIAGLSNLVLWSARTSERADARRKQAEDALRAASLYARSLIEASPDPLVTISAEGKITDVNTATEKATGVARNQLIGSDFSDYFTEPDRARAGYQEVFAKGAVTDYPLVLRHVSGSVIDVLYNASVYRDEHGAVAGVFAAARDVTKLKRTEHALRERVKELRAFFYISELAARTDFSLGSLCQELVNILPQSWQYPEITCARIVIGEQEFHTENFAASEWMLSAPITVPGDGGKVEVCYLQRRAEEDEGPFLKEERQLIDAIAERLGQIADLKRADQALRLQASQYATLLATTTDGYWRCKPDGRLLEVNDAYCRMSGYTREELLSMSIPQLEAVESPEQVARRIQQVLEDGFECFETRHRRKDGETWDVEMSVSYWRQAGELLQFARDITRRKRAEEALRNVGIYNRSLIEVSLDPLMTISVDGMITDVNEATVQATGMPRSLLVGSDFSSYFTEPERARAGYREVFAKGYVTDYPLSLRHVSGRVTEVLYNASVYRNARGEVAGAFAAARDITERRKLERELERQAHIDMLTDLNNRRHFLELAELELARARRHNEPLSLLMMDLDHFKQVNDRYGHHVGDAVLQKLAELCRHTFRAIDIVGRLGGEEFAALLPETPIEQALEVAERLRAAVDGAGVTVEGGAPVHFTISVGVAAFGAQEATIEAALKRADAALYQAKNAGRNRVCREQPQ
jgi:diguanylate cyclase (GGDEF)-like protein/PAS domain S-box-containing protein